MSWIAENYQKKKSSRLLIYGIKSSGNQVQALLKTVAALLNVGELITNTKSSDFNVIVQLPWAESLYEIKTFS